MWHGEGGVSRGVCEGGVLGVSGMVREVCCVKGSVEECGMVRKVC